MKKEFLKGLTMLLAIVAVAFATAVAANAQVSRVASSETSNNLMAVIPFEFTLDYKTMPAGEYLVQTLGTAGNGLLIQSIDGKTSAFRPSEAIERERNRGNARLVFHRYGERYFLSQVWCGGDSAGRQLMKSRDELDLEREVASINSKSEQAQSSYEIIEVAAIQNLAKLR
ncbi:MAG TPA: hypothetical protein VNO50_15765 [Pyrinomonadaceae bacterium]|nr:hypothetical protein [Pyrinomonadaceae bacterium]